MGQGTESCGGYDVEYDPYHEGLVTSQWTQRNGVSIHVKDMTLNHLRGASVIAGRAAQRATFSSNSEMWSEWVELFEREIESRGKEETQPKAVRHASPIRGTTAEMVCHCGAPYLAREADLSRGWALSCSKSCAAARRDFGRPAGKRAVYQEPADAR